MGAWYLLTVRFLKTNSGKKGEGMPVVRNPQFYFREGLCWSDINTTFLKCRIKQKSIHDVKSMSIFGVCDKVPEKYILCVINSTLISYYVDTFVNNTQTFQINDARQLPIIVPTSEQLSFCSALAKAAIAQKIKGNESSNIQKQLDDFIENQIPCLNISQTHLLFPPCHHQCFRKSHPHQACLLFSKRGSFRYGQSNRAHYEKILS